MLDRLLNQLVMSILIPLVNKIPLKYKTLTGFVLAVLTYGVDVVCNNCISKTMLTDELNLFTVLMGLWTTLFGVGIFHKAAKAEPQQ